ncbi:MAG: 50S ribosomal protein L25 [Thermoleophilia bacterium]|nr:50S ribosomal protein L25 [Thermoleophilia bacterium]
MAGGRIRLEVQARESRGTGDARRLRRQGLVPGVLYGSGKPRSFSVGERELRRVLGGEHGMHQILDVVIEGQQKAHHAVLKDYQLDPLRSTLLHIDLHEVRLDRPIQSQVTVELVGTPEGVTFGGVLTQMVREVTVEALPMEIPDRIEHDVSALEIGDSLQVGQLAAPEGATILDDAEIVLASVAAPRRAALPEEEGAAGEEGEEAAAAAAEAEAEAEAEAAE